jgi:hypothetical protein
MATMSIRPRASRAAGAFHASPHRHHRRPGHRGRRPGRRFGRHCPGIDLPDRPPAVAGRSCTPGAYNPDVTQSNINNTICVSGWTATVRPLTSCTNPLKAQGIINYRCLDNDIADYEEGHLAPLELGGAPRDPGNLWPELRAGAAWIRSGGSLDQKG